ncbi:MAG: N-acetylmuramoyl-L-alanine amidase [Bacteriovoracaceae bacterium]
MILLLSILYVSLQSSFASLDSVANDPLEFSEEGFRLFEPVPAKKIFLRTQAVLNYFQSPADSSNFEELKPFSGMITAADFLRRLTIVDRANQFSRFSNTSPDKLQLFWDRDSKSRKDAELDFSNQDGSVSVSRALENIKLAKRNPSIQQLSGLKIVIDPGHMSTKEWDSLTGKYVRDSQRNYISEGLINLQTSLLLKQELEKYGAEVRLTREDHEPVSKVPMEKLDLNEFGRKALKERSFENWFQSLITLYPEGPELYSAFKKSANFQALFKEKARGNYFILREDLQARINEMNDFEPDLSLVIHYDSLDPANDSNGVGTKKYSKVKTYIHGSVDPEEWATQDDRKFFALHLLDSAVWDASFSLAQSIVNNLSTGLGLQHDTSGGGNSYLVAPGVFARNLYITRKMTGHAHAYIECLHYNDPDEFKSLLKNEFPLLIDGETTYYSGRLKQVVTSIRNGILQFVMNFPEE